MTVVSLENKTDLDENPDILVLLYQNYRFSTISIIAESEQLPSRHTRNSTIEKKEDVEKTPPGCTLSQTLKKTLILQLYASAAFDRAQTLRYGYQRNKIRRKIDAPY